MSGKLASDVDDVDVEAEFTALLQLAPAAVAEPAPEPVDGEVLPDAPTDIPFPEVPSHLPSPCVPAAVCRRRPSLIKAPAVSAKEPAALLST